MFAVNQQNYSRWIIRFYDNLKPDLKEKLMNGRFSTITINKSLSRSSIDLTLKETVLQMPQIKLGALHI